MLTSIAAKGVAPYKQIITHGWTVDGEGKAMHKSLGNAVGPEEVIKDYGADMLRLWVASADYTQDMRISKDIMKQLSQAYLKIRNTARYMLGNLCDFNPDTDQTPLDRMEALDRFALASFNDLVKTVREAYVRYEFHAVYRAVYNFCVVDMSNFYLDIIKDRLYCGDAHGRRSAQTALYTILDGMTRLIAPILAFTSDEIWAAMRHDRSADTESVLLNDMPGYDEALALSEADQVRWDKLISVRDAVNKALENARAAGVFKKAQDTEVTLSVAEQKDADFLSGVDLAPCASSPGSPSPPGRWRGKRWPTASSPAPSWSSCPRPLSACAAGTITSTWGRTTTTPSCAPAAPGSCAPKHKQTGSGPAAIRCMAAGPFCSTPPEAPSAGRSGPWCAF